MDDWQIETLGLFKFAKGYDRHDKSTHGVLSSVGQAYNSFLKKVGGRIPPEWSEDLQRTLNDRHKAKVGEMPHEAVATLNKCVRIGHALATGRFGWLLPSEGEWLAATGRFTGAPARDAPPPPPPGDTFEVSFAFPYQGYRPGTKAFAMATSTGVAKVRRIPADRAAVAWRLPYADGEGAIEVLRHDGVLYRPVLRPGTREPVGEAEFVEACRGGDPWKDDPFAERRCGPPVAPVEFANAAAPVGDAVARHDEALASCLVRADELVSVGGRVFRSTHAPSFQPVYLGRRQLHVDVGWRLAGLTSHDDQSPLVRLSEGNNRSIDWGVPYASTDSWFHLADLAVYGQSPFAFTSWRLAREVALGCAATGVGPFREPEGLDDDPFGAGMAVLSSLPDTPAAWNVVGLRDVARSVVANGAGPGTEDVLRDALASLPSGDLGRVESQFRELARATVEAALKALPEHLMSRDSEDEECLSLAMGP